MFKDLFIKKKQFKAEDGTSRDYISYEVELDGEVFTLVARAEDKRLIKFLLSDNDHFNKKGELKVELDIYKRTFKGEDGASREYIAYEFELSGEIFNLVPRAEDKKLLKHIFKDEFDGSDIEDIEDLP